MKKIIPLLIGLQAINALNIYSDMYAKPQFNVGLHKDHYILQEKVFEILNNEEGYEYMRTGDKRYLCIVPKIEQEEEQDQRNDLANLSSSQVSTDVEVVKSRAVGLLEPLTNSCLYLNSGYWTYAVCYERYVQQFHSEITELNKAPVPQENTPIYYLGKYETGDKDSLLAESVDGVTYFAQRLGNGTICDLTGEERTVEVRYFCNEKVAQDRVAWIKEIKTCHYEMAIHTTRLCSEVAFAPANKSQDSYEIACNRILTEKEMQEIKTQEEMLQNTLPESNKEEEVQGEGKVVFESTPRESVDNHAIVLEAESFDDLNNKLEDIMQLIIQVIEEGGKEFTLFSTDSQERSVKISDQADYFMTIHVHVDGEIVKVLIKLEDGVLYADIVDDKREETELKESLGEENEADLEDVDQPDEDIRESH